jgi:hypothetical protein
MGKFWLPGPGKRDEEWSELGFDGVICGCGLKFVASPVSKLKLEHPAKNDPSAGNQIQERVIEAVARRTPSARKCDWETC